MNELVKAAVTAIINALVKELATWLAERWKNKTDADQTTTAARKMFMLMIFAIVVRLLFIGFCVYQLNDLARSPMVLTRIDALYIALWVVIAYSYLNAIPEDFERYNTRKEHSQRVKNIEPKTSTD